MSSSSQAAGNPFRRILDRLAPYGRRLQAGAVKLLLHLLYLLGLGTTRLYMGLFHRRLLLPPPPRSGSNWHEPGSQPLDQTLDNQS